MRSRLLSVFKILSDGEWHTILEIARQTGYSESSISSQIRDFRKAEYGGFNITRKIKSGLAIEGDREYFYRLNPFSGNGLKMAQYLREANQGE